MARLIGTCIRPTTIAEARELVGKTVIYLRRADIDYTGRGYFFPRIGVVKAARYNNIELENGDIYTIKSFVEMVEATEENRRANFDG